MRIHDLRHNWTSQGVMNGVGLPTVGRLLGHTRLATVAIYAHLDDNALQAAAAQAASVIAGVMGYRAEPPPLSVEADGAGDGREPDRLNGRKMRAVQLDPQNIPPEKDRNREGAVSTSCDKTT